MKTEDIITLLHHHFSGLEVEVGKWDVTAIHSDGDLEIVVDTLGAVNVEIKILDGVPVFYREFETLEDLNRSLEKGNKIIANRLQNIISILNRWE